MKSDRLIALFLFAVAAALPECARAEEKPEAAPLDAKAGFEMLKSLAGDWEGTAARDGAKHTPGTPEKPVLVTYRVAASDSAVIETYYAGEPKEMISVYTMDGPDRIVMTHYCALGNQPRMRMEKSAAPGELKFVFDGGTNFDPAKDLHVHEGTIRFVDADNIVGAFAAFKDGQKLSTNNLNLKRKK